jgi:hypothetical protein
MRVFTLATAATLAQARALAGSLRRVEPEWSFEIVLIDLCEPALADDPTPIKRAADELDVDLATLISRHEEEDLRRLLLPRAMLAYSRRRLGPVLHLPPSVWALAALDPVREGLTERSVLLAPRVGADLPDDGLAPTPEQLERAGRTAETVLGVDGSAVADGFLHWLAARTEATYGTLQGVPSRVRPEDRPWLARMLELAPARFAVAMLDDAGCNVSMWNIPGHVLSDGPGGPLIDGGPLRFLDLPGFDPRHPFRLNRIASRVRVSRSATLRSLCERYADELLECGWSDLHRRGEIGRELLDGMVYDEQLLGLYARALALGQDFGDLFSERGAASFMQWLEGPAPAGAAYGVSRYVFYRVASERPDVLRAYPDLDGADGAGYVAWCSSFGRSEMGLAERFLSSPAPASKPTALAVESQGAGGSVPARSGVPAVPADVPAVRVTGYLRHSLGLGAAARGYAEALAATGVPVSTSSVPLHHLELPDELSSGYGLHSFDDLLHEGRHGFELVAVNADELPDLVKRLGPGYFEGPRIGIWGWETNAIPARWADAFSLVDEIWVYSRFMAENMGAVAPVPVLAMPPPVHLMEGAVRPVRLGVPEGFTFLFVFDYLSTIQRKNPVGLIEAFKRAFAPAEGPRLLIKTINGPLRPLAEEELLWAAGERPDVHLIDRSLSSGELTGLMAACDCYVSLHRSEGFGLTMAEAMAMGKPVIATGYSGNVDFMDDANSFLVDWRLGRVGPECEIYPPEGEWAEPDLEHAARLMRSVYEDPAQAALVGERARADVAARLSSRVTGERMRKRLEELAANE